MTEMIEGLVLPDVEHGDAAPFWAGCAAGELRVQSCSSCGLRRMPPRPMCPACRSFEQAWDATAGTATIWSFIVAHPPLLPAYAAQAPYNVVVVSLDDDPAIRLVGNVVSGAGARLDSVDPSELKIGAAVQVVFSQAADDVVIPQWTLRPRKGA
ncbi:MAG: Zn-ribbon domain-containing OB-fold protein [Acidimicrobiales bacterium]